MRDSFLNLLRHTASRVTLEIIQSYARVDPGHYAYVDCLNKVRTSLHVPHPIEFDLAEPIRFATWGDPDSYDFPDEFRAYRRFTTSIVLFPMEMDALNGFQPIDDFHGSRLLAYNLIVDASIDDKEHLLLTRSAMMDARSVLTAPIKEVLPDFQFIDDGCVYFTLGMLFISQLLDDWDSSEKFATQLILDVHEGNMPNGEMIDYPTGDEFSNDTIQNNWLAMTRSLINPTGHADTDTVIRKIDPDNIAG